MFWFPFSTDTACRTDYKDDFTFWLNRSCGSLQQFMLTFSITHFIVKLLEYLCLFWQTPPPRKPRILDKRQKKTSSSHLFLSFSFFFCGKAPSHPCWGLIKNSPGLCRGKRMCLLQHFYAIYNVQFVCLIEPSRPIEITASALFNSLGVN